jgi:transcriptional regulator with XRE-family HTH domain
VQRKRAIDGRVGSRVAEARKAHGLSQARLASAIGVTTGAIQAYEHGRTRIPVERLEALADALQCAPADLLPRRT